MIDGVDYSQRFFEDVAPGDELPRVDDEITYRRVIMNPATTWDYFPGHHDPEYARAQGQPTIYVNTMHFLGFADRVVSEWAGPRSFLVRRKVSTLMSIYAGDTMVGTGQRGRHAPGGAGRLRPVSGRRRAHGGEPTRGPVRIRDSHDRSPGPGGRREVSTVVVR